MFRKALITLAIGAIALTATACNTVRGAGRDLESVATKTQEAIKDKKVPAIDTERALLAPERISQIVSYVREHFDQKTKRGENYPLAGKRVHGFNALFATASIEAAKRWAR